MKLPTVAAIVVTYAGLGALVGMAWDRATTTAHAAPSPMITAPKPVQPPPSYTALPKLELPRVKPAVKSERPQPKPDRRPYSESMLCLAHNIFFEGRGESRAGQLAIAHVVLNRVADPAFPNTICDVIFHSRKRGVWQFSWVADKPYLNLRTPSERRAYAIAMSIADSVLAGTTVDPTNGATHYYNPDKIDPVWAAALPLKAEIGQHRFLQ